jgi:hypothetical protein
LDFLEDYEFQTLSGLFPVSFCMELLLNLAWLLLALPAYWLWRRSAQERGYSSLQCLLTLACALVILFPVVSATDDLHAMRAVMEEPGTNKKIRQAGNDRIPAGSRGEFSAVVAAVVAISAPGLDGRLEMTTPRSILPVAHAVLRAGRAPPSYFPG